MTEVPNSQEEKDKASRPVMVKELEVKEDGRILYYYSFLDSFKGQSSQSESLPAEGCASSQSPRTEAKSGNGEGAKK